MRRELEIDWLTILLYLLIVIMGWINLFSTSVAGEGQGIFDLSSYHGKQLLFIGISLFLGTIIIYLDKKFLEFVSYGVYGLGILALVALLFFGKTTKGATNWFQIGGFSLQPSEFVKVATMMALSKWMTRFQFNLRRTTDFLVAGAIVLLPMAMIVLQNDAGSAIVFTGLIIVFYREGMHPAILLGIILMTVVGVTTLLLADVPNSLIFIITGIIAAAVGSLYYFKWKFLVPHLLAVVILAGSAFALNKVIKPYQRLRLKVLIASEEEIKESKPLQEVAYNYRESLVAIGSGGAFGKGYGNGTHTRGDFVPEEHTDYIFCVIGEEHGWIGSTFVIILYVLFMMRIFYLAENSKSKYARIFGYGFASFLLLHFMINVGMTIGLVPTVGIPLPFFSYGGSSFISFSIMTFFLINQYSHRSNILGNEAL